MAVRSLELILTATGGAELADIDTERTLWASDSDEEFREEFPDVLDENDIEAIFDWLIEADFLTEDEADAAEVSIETIQAQSDEEFEPVEGEYEDGG